MNTTAILTLLRDRLAAILRKAPAIPAGIPIRIAVEEPHEDESAALLSIDSYEEIVPGNYTFRLTAAASLTLRPSEHTASGTADAGDAFGAAVVRLCTGLRRTEGDTFVILHAQPLPPPPAVEDGSWRFTAQMELYVQY